MATAGSLIRSEFDFGRPEERKIFTNYREELQWLATFLMADEKLAGVCVIDVCAIADSHSKGFDKWLFSWARLATIREAIQAEHPAIIEVASTNARRRCSHRGHPPLSLDSFEGLVEQSKGFAARLDVLSRFALVILGVEKQSADDAAAMLGVTPECVEGAYCAALRVIDRASLSNKQHLAAVRN